MNTFQKMLLMGAFVIMPLAFVGGCSDTVEHTESDKPGWFGNSRTHEEKTVKRNPDGTYTTEYEKSKVRNP